MWWCCHTAPTKSFSGELKWPQLSAAALHFIAQYHIKNIRRCIVYEFEHAYIYSLGKKHLKFYTLCIYVAACSSFMFVLVTVSHMKNSWLTAALQMSPRYLKTHSGCTSLLWHVRHSWPLQCTSLHPRKSPHSHPDTDSQIPTRLRGMIFLMRPSEMVLLQGEGRINKKEKDILLKTISWAQSRTFELDNPLSISDCYLRNTALIKQGPKSQVCCLCFCVTKDV